MQIDHFRPIPVKSCPNFTGAAASVQIKSVQPAPGFLGYADGTMVVALANSCPAGANTAIAAARYLLGHVGFVHAASVTGVGVSG